MSINTALTDLIIAKLQTDENSSKHQKTISDLQFQLENAEMRIVELEKLSHESTNK